MKRFLWVVFAIMFLPLCANAASVVDMDDTDNMKILSTEKSPGWLKMTESYGENTLVPYPSPGDDLGIVNAGSFFDVKMTIDPADLDPDQNPQVSLMLEFYIANATVHSWTDYHFEFLDADQLTPVDLVISTTSGPEIFENTNYTGSGTYNRLDFWTELGDVYPPADSFFDVFVEIEIDLRASNLVAGNSFIIRQVATTTPVPGAMLLTASGLLCLTGLRRRY